MRKKRNAAVKADICLEAAENIFISAEDFCCASIYSILNFNNPEMNDAARLEVRRKFSKLFHPDDDPAYRSIFWSGLSYNPGNKVFWNQSRQHRILMLLFMREMYRGQS